MQKISIGMLKHRLTLLHTHCNFDKFGGWTESVQAGAKVWGCVFPIMTRESYQMGRIKNDLMTQNEYQQPMPSLRYRVLLRSDCPVKDVTALKWHQKTEDIFLLTTCNPFLVLEDQFWCVMVSQQKRER